MSLPARVDLGGLVLALADPDGIAVALAGDGVQATRIAGRTELRACREGVPRLEEGRIHIDPVRIPADLGEPLEVHGDVRIDGAVLPGTRLVATGVVAVAGGVEQATLTAGTGLLIAGTATRAELHCGHLAGTADELAEMLEGVTDGLVRVADMALAAGRDPARRQRAIDQMLAGREAGLDARIRAVEARLQRARNHWPGVHESLTAAIVDARRALAGSAVIDDPAIALLSAAAAIRAATTVRRRVEAPVRIAALEDSRLEVLGSLHIEGQGITASDVRIGGDLVATDPAAAIVAGRLVTGGRVRVGRLAAERRRPLEVVLQNLGTPDAPLRAGFVDAGVTIDMAGERFSFTSAARDVEVVVDARGPRVVTGAGRQAPRTGGFRIGRPFRRR